MQLVDDRARARIAALEPTADARRAAERLLQELVPLDDERRAEAEVWLAFTGRALVDPRQRAIYRRSMTSSTAPAPARSACCTTRG